MRHLFHNTWMDTDSYVAELVITMATGNACSNTYPEADSRVEYRLAESCW
jgi:hypothetical protein